MIHHLHRQLNIPGPHVAPTVVDGVGQFDVICGRHKDAFNNVGNRRFRVTINLSIQRYLRAESRRAKSSVLISIVEQIYGSGGRFLKCCNKSGGWIELSNKEARAKVGHAIRDMAVAKNLMTRASSTLLSPMKRPGNRVQQTTFEPRTISRHQSTTETEDTWPRTMTSPAESLANLSSDSDLVPLPPPLISVVSGDAQDQAYGPHPCTQSDIRHEVHIPAWDLSHDDDHVVQPIHIVPGEPEPQITYSRSEGELLSTLLGN